MKKIEKKNFGFGKKSFGSNTNTKIGPWFRFPIPKHGFGHTLNKLHTCNENAFPLWIQLNRGFT